MSIFEVPNPTFPERTRVTKPLDVDDPDSPVRHGEVEMTYKLPATGWGELCVVRWDDGERQEGLLPSGLERE